MGFEVKIYDTQRCTYLQILTAFFTKKPQAKLFLLHEQYPKSTQSQGDIFFFGKQTVVFVQLCHKKKENKSRAMKEKWEDSGLSLSNITYSLFLSSSPQPAKATGRCSIALQMDQEWHTYSYICLAHSYFLLYVACQLARQ